MPKPEKIRAVEDLRERIRSAESVVMTDFRGMTVGEMEDLRSRLREKGVVFKVVKNTLARIALQEEGFNPGNSILDGPLAMAFSPDEVSAAREISGFRKSGGKPEFKAGILESRIVSSEEVGYLASLPSREEVLSRLLSLINAPAQRLLMLMNEPGARVARLVKAGADRDKN